MTKKVTAPTGKNDGVKRENGKLSFELSDGRKVEIIEGQGNDSVEATKVSGDNGSDYLPALMAQLTTIEGKPVTMEELKVMKLRDFMKIQAHFSEINF